MKKLVFVFVLFTLGLHISSCSKSDDNNVEIKYWHYSAVFLYEAKSNNAHLKALTDSLKTELKDIEDKSFSLRLEGRNEIFVVFEDSITLHRYDLHDQPAFKEEKNNIESLISVQDPIQIARIESFQTKVKTLIDKFKVRLNNTEYYGEGTLILRMQFSLLREKFPKQKKDQWESLRHFGFRMEYHPAWDYDS